MNWRRAAVSDYLSLAELSHLLIREARHRSRAVPELEQRMRAWRGKDYTAGSFENGAEVRPLVACRSSVGFRTGSANYYSEGNGAALERTRRDAEGSVPSLSMNSI